MAHKKARENVDRQYEHAHRLAVDVVERSYPPEDVATLRHFKKKYGNPCDVVAKDKCFYFAHNEDLDDDGDIKETKSHFDFGLFGNLNGSEYDNEDGKKFAFAYYREDLICDQCWVIMNPAMHNKRTIKKYLKKIFLCLWELQYATSCESR